MNTPSPLVPQGTFQEKGGKSHVRITVFAILAIHVVALGVLLIAGCNKKSGETGLAENAIPPVPAAPGTEPWPTPGQGSPQSNDAVIPPVPPPVPPPIPAQPETSLAPTPVVPAQPVQPTDSAPIPAVTDAGFIEHTVLKGEALATIGKKYGVGYKAIEAANPGINPTRLKIGEKIKIPRRTAATVAAAPASPTGNGGATIYVVKSGDNLLKISKTTGVSVKQLRAANNLRTDQIRVGQKLKIPTRPATPPPVESIAPPPVAPPVPASTPLEPQ